MTDEIHALLEQLAGPQSSDDGEAGPWELLRRYHERARALLAQLDSAAPVARPAPERGDVEPSREEAVGDPGGTPSDRDRED